MKRVILAPFIVILVLGIIATVTRHGLFYDILIWTGIGSFTFAILIAGAKLSGFSEVIGLKIPIGEKLSALNFAALATIWGFFVFIFAFVWLAIPTFIRYQNFLKTLSDFLKSFKESSPW